MDIAALSMAMSNQKTMEAVGTAMLKNSLEFQEDIGKEVVKLIDSAAMERSVNPAIGQNIDFSV